MCHRLGDDLSAAVEALRSNNVTCAINEASSGMFYFGMPGIPNNCLINE
jgi:hypothetical protein